MPKKPNRLIHEKSPYLLQHAHNPVDWYPWVEEAFERAKEENKPIFLSIGYSTCHWCHVMEHESFEDLEIAELLNRTFICIKVDREERPDIDSTYMMVCQIMTGGGGWPLTIIMTPDKKPFFATTYVPKESRFDRAGIRELITQMGELWQSKKGKITQVAERVIMVLGRGLEGKTKADEETLNKAFRQLSDSFDEGNGGFGNAPKFPSPHNLFFLLRYWKRTGEKRAISMVETTLNAMRMGGIFDHLGFGFHRYSTDARWLVPHFEKMLYDQALLTMAYTEAYQATKKKVHRETACEILTYVLRDMRSEEGGFYSAEDADSEGVEGKFYLWSASEIKKVLSKDEAELVMKVLNVSEEGNGYAQKNILHKTQSIKSASDLEESKIEDARKKLFEARKTRVHPGKDDKILTDWNGLMIAALAKASKAFEKEEYAETAKDCAEFILSKISRGVYHMYRDGEARVQGFLDDYSFLIWGLIELYGTTFESRYLKHAISLTDEMTERFWDERGGFYFTQGEGVLVREKEFYDTAYPSGNSVAMLDLLLLSRFTGKPEYEELASRLARSPPLEENPTAFTQLLVALDFAIGPSYEIVIVGDKENAGSMLRAVRRNFIPNKVVILKDDDVSRAGYAKGMRAIGEKPTAYVCRNYRCEQPTTEIDKLLELIEG